MYFNIGIFWLVSGDPGTLYLLLIAKNTNLLYIISSDLDTKILIIGRYRVGMLFSRVKHSS